MHLPAPNLSAFTHVTWPINGLQMHIAQVGARDDGSSIIVFLHGFPDLWCGWARIMLALADSFTCIAPDQRGYNHTSRPTDIAAYAPHHLLDDIDALIDKASPHAPVTLVGHDWGGVLVAWHLAARRNGRVARAVLVNATHPALLQRALWRDEAQRKASQYIQSLRSGQIEQNWRADMAAARTEPALRSGAMSEAEAALYRAAWESPEAWRAMIDWYRAAPFTFEPQSASEDWTMTLAAPITTPTLVLWGAEDAIFLPALRDGMSDYFDTLHIKTIAGIGHNPLREAPAWVATEIRSFVSPPTV